MSLKDRFNKPEPIPKPETKPVAPTKPTPLPTATQRDFQEMQKKKDAEKAVLKLIEQNDQPEMKDQRNTEAVVEQPQKNEVITSDQAKDQQKTEKLDLTQKNYDQRRPVVDQTTSRPVTGRPVVDQDKLVDQLLLVDQKEHSYPTRLERQKIGLRLPAEKVAQYKMWCFFKGIDLQDAVEQAMDRLLVDQPLLDDQKKLVDQTTSSGTLLRDHDFNDFKRSSLESDKLSYTISIYEKYTGNKFSNFDHKFYEQIKDVDKEDIRLGIMQSVAGCKTKVLMFKYCINAIRKSVTIKDKQTQEKVILEQLEKKNPTTKG